MRNAGARVLRLTRARAMRSTAALTLMLGTASTGLVAIAVPAHALAPAPVVDSSSPQVESDPTPTIAFHAVLGTPALECAVSGAGVVPTAWGPCDTDTSHTFPALGADGDYDLSVREQSATDDGEVAAVRYTLDTVAQLSVLAPASPGKDATPVWTISTEPGATTTCAFDGGPADPCTGSFTAPALSTERAYSLTVVATDEPGNVSTPSVTSYVLDTTAPTAPTVTGASGRANDTTPTWSFANPDGDTALCTLSEPVGTPTEVPCTDGTGHTPTVSDQGDYQVSVVLRDAAGNRSPAGSGPTYTLDTDAPAAPAFSSLPTSPSTSTTVTWSFSTPGAGHTCTLERGTTVVSTTACDLGSSTHTLALDGSYTLTVVADDGYGNSSTPAISPAYVLDTTGPTVTVTAPTGLSNDSTPHVTWVGEMGQDVTAQCRWRRTVGAVTTDGPWEDCTAAFYDPTLPGDGSYAFQAQETDALGNAGPVGTAPGSYQYDGTAPAPPVLTAPTTPGNDTTPTVGWTSADVASCAVVAGSSVPPTTVFSSCTTSSSFTPTLPSDGTWTLAVRLTDPAGNTGSAATFGYVLDTAGPAPVVISGVSSPNKNPRPRWLLAVDGDTVSTNCRVLVGFPGTTVISSDPCGGSYQADLTGVADGTYTIEVTAFDTLGNTSVARQAYVLDTTKPLKPTVTGPSSPNNIADPTWTFPVQVNTTAVCRLVQGLAASAWSACNGSYTVTGIADGTYTVEVEVSDVAGNLAPVGVSSPYTSDRTKPAAPVVASPASPGKATTVSWTFTPEPGGTATCRLDRNGVVGSSVLCSSGTFSPALTGEASYVVVVILTDQAGNVGDATTTPAYVLDTTDPAAPVLSGPTGTSNVATVTWSWTSEAGSTSTCTLVRNGVAQAPAACASGTPRTLPSDATYALQVRVTDAAGNSSITVQSPPYVLDRVAPMTPVLTTPASPSNVLTPSFTFTSEAGSAPECRLMRGTTVVRDWTACSSPLAVDLTGLADATYSVDVRSTDLAGNTSPVGSSLGYQLDTAAPAIPTVTVPASPSSSTRPTVTWVGEAGTSASCRLVLDGVNQNPVACSTPWVPTLAGDGSWVVRVRLTDAAGNQSQPGISSAYVLDTTAPLAPVVTPAAPVGRTTAPSWSATYETGTSAECRLMTGATLLVDWSSCTLPYVTDLSSRPDGSYTLSVRVTDQAGLVSPVGSATYLLDTTAPVAPTFTSLPASPGRSRALSYSFTGESGTTTYCKLTSGATTISPDTACSSPLPVSLAGQPDGAYTLTAHSVDAAGNSGPAQTASYVLDTAAPAAPTLVSGPAAIAPDTTPRWTFTPEPGATVVCRVVGSATSFSATTTPCASPYSVLLPADDTYTFTATATDAAGNTGPALTRSYTLDGTAPATADVTGPRSPGRNTSPTWSVSSLEGTVQCHLLKTPSTLVRDWATCGPTFSVALAGDGTYTMSARVVDSAGNLSPVVTSTYVLDTVAPAAATIVVPASPSTDQAPTFVISSADPGVTAQCQVIPASGPTPPLAPCAVSAAGSPYNLDLRGDPDGPYTLVVRLTDAAGNVGADARGTYVLDTLAPASVLVTAPASPSSVATPSWGLTGDSDSALECRLSGPGFAAPVFSPCPASAVPGTSTFTADLTAKADGTFTLTARSRDAAGNLGPEASSSYELDRIAPATPAAPSVPPSPAQAPTIDWTFAVDAGTTALCTLSSATAVITPEAPCTSPLTTTLPSDGTYTLSLRARDAALNTSGSSASNYVLDRLAPAAPSITTEPGSPGPEQVPSWSLTASEAGGHLECQLVGLAGSTWATCTDPVSFDLAPATTGTYTLQVRQLDDAGNVSELVSSKTYVYDQDAPMTPDVSPPAVSPGNSTTPVFAVSRKSGDVDTVSLQCAVTRFDGLAATADPCEYGDNTVDLGAVAPGSEGAVSLSVAGVDAAANVGGATTATYLFDNKPPVVPLIRALQDVEGLSAKVSWSFGGGDTEVVAFGCAVAKKGVVVQPTSATACAGTKDVTLPSYGEWTLTVWALDRAGNVSTPATSSYLYLPPVPVVTGIRAPATGADATPTWTFTVPRPGYTATCIVSDSLGTTIATGDCTNGRFTPDLTDRAGGAYTLTVQLTDSHGNVGAYSARSAYRYTPALQGGGVIGQPGPRPEPGPGGGNGNGNGGSPVPTGSGGTGGPGLVPTEDPEPQHGSDNGNAAAGGTGGAPTAGGKTSSGGGTKAIARPQPGRIITDEVPKAIGNTLKQVAQKPTIPLVLLGVVVGFLLLQNRIDRRDPKLASAPVGAEPELDFGPVLGMPGPTPRTLGGGAPA